MLNYILIRQRQTFNQVASGNIFGLFLRKYIGRRVRKWEKRLIALLIQRIVNLFKSVCGKW